MPNKQKIVANVSNNSSQTDALSILAQLEWDARRALTKEDLSFIVANETNRLIKYDQMVLFFGQKVFAVSGGVQLDHNAPYIRWVDKLCSNFMASEHPESLVKINPSDIPEESKAGWKEWGSKNALWFPLLCSDGKVVGGALIFRDNREFTDGELRILDRLFNAYAQSYALLDVKERFTVKGILQKLPGYKVWLVSLLIVLVILLMPKSQSVTAPAEVVARDPLAVTSQVSGVIKRIHVHPNQRVKEGDLIATYDDIELRSQYEIAKKALAVARADYNLIIQKSFSDPESKSQVVVLKAKVKEKQAELKYAKDQLDRTQLIAPEEGVVVFDDPNEIIGKPLQIGDAIMNIANPDKSMLEIYVSVDDAVTLRKGSDVRFIMNVDPLSPVDASLGHVSYVAVPTPDQTVAYRAEADFVDKNNSPRLGLKGSATIYGEDVTLFYYLMRRPLSAFRRALGF